MKLAYLFKTFFALDLIFVLLHIIIGESNYYFNLDQERNFPVYYQAFKYVMLSSLLFLSIYLVSRINKFSLLKKLLVGNFAVFVFLVIDELGEFHENIKRILDSFGFNTDVVINFVNDLGYNSTEWLIFYIPIFAAIFFLMIRTLWYFYIHFPKKVFAFYALGIGCFIVVPIVEYLSIKQPRESFEYYWLIIIEEGLELLGVSLFFASVYYLFRKLQSNNSIGTASVVS